MSRKYYDLAIVKTNKPNSKKTINEFAEEFGYNMHLEEELSVDKRSIGITIVSEDLIFELEDFSRNRNDKFTLSFSKVDKKNPDNIHILDKYEFTNGKVILQEKDDTKRILIEKEEKSIKEKELSQFKKKQNNKNRKNNNNNNNKKYKPKGYHKSKDNNNNNNNSNSNSLNTKNNSRRRTKP